MRQEFVIGGWTDPRGSRTALGSLLLGYYYTPGEAGQPLRYAGKVGTGFTDEMLRTLLGKLRPLTRKSSPFTPDADMPKKGVHFVTPRLVCDVGFSEWTHDEHVRHPLFLGLRPDKSPREVVRERPAT
jgi:bifunctional non-homologous end joining protein LigD